VPIELQCPECKSYFRTKPSQAERRKWCSRECRKIGLRKERQKDIEVAFGEPVFVLISRLYHIDQLGIKQIAKILKVSDRNLWEWFNDLDIERRDRSFAVEIQWQNNDERRNQAAQVMKKLNKERDYTGNNNPAKQKDTREKISKSKLGPRNAMYGRFGSRNPNWKGGKITYRGRGWHGIRTMVIRRDKNRCRRCGSRKQLQVHHIIPYRKNQDNSFDNLVTLCASCHMAVEYKGASWD